MNNNKENAEMPGMCSVGHAWLPSVCMPKLGLFDHRVVKHGLPLLPPRSYIWIHLKDCEVYVVEMLLIIAHLRAAP